MAVLILKVANVVNVDALHILDARRALLRARSAIIAKNGHSRHQYVQRPREETETTLVMVEVQTLEGVQMPPTDRRGWTNRLSK